ncbi:MAG: NAD-dependent epimerase/dehydratase family protein [Proteobacteria bacterium]|nr:NAD-dependent epimerase/dehydratase family protein [Pseudomonadota bacterium]
MSEHLKQKKYTWLVTGVAGFIGSHLLETLLKLDQKVIGLDNFLTGNEKNLELVKKKVGDQVWRNFSFLYGDICSPEDCAKAISGVHFVLHQAALGSVPRSVADPKLSTKNNINGFIEILLAAKNEGVKRFVYASSSSVYGDITDKVKVEHRTGKVLSPYAATKKANELYSDAFSNVYKIDIIGLRYFNVFGARQNPHGEYAAVIPRWLDTLVQGKQCVIYGDGETSRDFCFIDNVVQANILSAFAEKEACNTAYNIAFGKTTTLNQLHGYLVSELKKHTLKNPLIEDPLYQDFRAGDVKSSLADIEAAKKNLGYDPKMSPEDGFKKVVEDFLNC